MFHFANPTNKCFVTTFSYFLFPFIVFLFLQKKKIIYIYVCLFVCLFFWQLLFVEYKELLMTPAHFQSCSFVGTTPWLLSLLAVPATWIMPELIRDKITLTLEAQVNNNCPQVTIKDK